MSGPVVEALGWLRERRLDPADEPARWHAALRRAFIPERHWNCDASAVRDPSGRFLRAMADPGSWANQGWGWFINGPFDTGKSAAAAIIAMEFVRRAHPVIWLPVRDVPTVRFHESDESTARDALLGRADLLVLDDLGAERFRLDSAAGGALEEVVRIMYDRHRPVVFTSNIGFPDQFSSMYGIVPAFISVVNRLSIPLALTRSWGTKPDDNFGVPAVVR